MILLELLEGSNWGKVSRKKDFAAKTPKRGEGDGSKPIDGSRLSGRIPPSLEKLAKAYGAWWDEEKQGWYTTGRVPGELRDALRHSRG